VIVEAPRENSVRITFFIFFVLLLFIAVSLGDEKVIPVSSTPVL
jgi:hypothetical protein